MVDTTFDDLSLTTQGYWAADWIDVWPDSPHRCQSIIQSGPGRWKPREGRSGIIVIRCVKWIDHPGSHADAEHITWGDWPEDES